MLTTITLGGHLGGQFGDSWQLDLSVPSASEAIRALCAVCSGFKAYLVEHSLPGFHVFYGKDNLTLEDLHKPGQNIVIMPVLAGASKEETWLTTIAGAVLIAAGAIIAVVSLGSLAWLSTPMIGIGISMTIGGAAQLLFPPPPPFSPSDAEDSNSKPSSTFNGPVNTLAQGHPVPICYGELEVGSQVISAGIHTNWSANGNYTGTTTSPSGGGSSGSGFRVPRRQY